MLELFIHEHVSPLAQHLPSNSTGCHMWPVSSTFDVALRTGTVTVPAVVHREIVPAYTFLFLGMD